MEDLEYRSLLDNLTDFGLSRENREEILTQLKEIEREIEKTTKEKKLLVTKQELRDASIIAFVIMSDNISEERKEKILGGMKMTPFTTAFKKNVLRIKKQKDKTRPPKSATLGDLKGGILGMTLPSLFKILKDAISTIIKVNQEVQQPVAQEVVNENIVKKAKNNKSKQNEFENKTVTFEKITLARMANMAKKPALAVFATSKSVINGKIAKPTEITKTSKKNEKSFLEQLAEEKRNPKKQSHDLYPPLHAVDDKYSS